MHRLQQLRKEHAELMAITGRLSAMIARDVPPPSTELFVLRRELSSALIRHLKAEDWLLYPRLLVSPNQVVARTALSFSEEMGGLAQAFTEYAERWGSYAIESDREGYRKETADIIEALTNRIKREDRELYPLLEKLNMAA